MSVQLSVSDGKVESQKKKTRGKREGWDLFTLFSNISVNRILCGFDMYKNDFRLIDIYVCTFK